MEEKDLNKKNQENTNELSAADKILQKLKQKKEGENTQNKKEEVSENFDKIEKSESDKDKKIPEEQSDETKISEKTEKPESEEAKTSRETEKTQNKETVEKSSDKDEQETERKKNEKGKASEKAESTESSEQDKEEAEKQEQPEKKKYQIPDFSRADITKLSDYMKEYAETQNPADYTQAVKELKSEFFKRISTEKKEKKEKYVEDGGDPRDFKLPPDENEQKFNELTEKYYNKLNAYRDSLDKTMRTNLAAKYEIIAAIENLVNKPESFGETYHEFRALQDRWNEIGTVPRSESKKMWDEYHRVVEKFFSYVKINKELRDLDMKKNLETKINLCEKAEELLIEPKIQRAHSKLQDLHDRWREVGPVIKEKKEEIWERFKSATIKINEKFQEHIEMIREQQEKNLEAKEFLCQEAEKYAEGEYKSRKEWKKASDQVIKMQKLWKGIGFVPKKHNNEIYDRFRNACDKFFDRIRTFYDKADAERELNMQKKEDLCVQAESMQDSTDWRKTTDFYIKIQKEWKEIGPVPNRHSDKIWKRFRKACNSFFERKKEHFKGREIKEKENLELKKELIRKILDTDTEKNRAEAVAKLKEYQKEWTQIGFVPYEEKDSVYKEYRVALDKKFGEMNVDAEKAAELEFDERIETIKNASNADDLAQNEITKLRSKIDKMEADIKVWENNLGFFANTKNAESMLKDFNKKIERSKQKVKDYKKQIKELSQIK